MEPFDFMDACRMAVFDAVGPQFLTFLIAFAVIAGY
jgi:hypothetical protein